MTTEFIKHDGGECPVAKGTLIDVKYRGGVIALKIPALEYQAGKSGATDWEHSYCSFDITHWRLAKQTKQENEPVADEEFSLLHILADIRAALGVGDKPMLTELAPLVKSIKQQNNLRKATISKLEADKDELIELIMHIKNTYDLTYVLDDYIKEFIAKMKGKK